MRTQGHCGFCLAAGGWDGGWDRCSTTHSLTFGEEPEEPSSPNHRFPGLTQNWFRAQGFLKQHGCLQCILWPHSVNHKTKALFISRNSLHVLRKQRLQLTRVWSGSEISQFVTFSSNHSAASSGRPSVNMVVHDYPLPPLYGG